MTRVRVRISDEELAELLALAREMNLTPNVVMRTALARLSDEWRESHGDSTGAAG
ncbi:hypothetical protein [Streptomyces sp. NPDC002619]|uniref:hypothetical protein n=1 Tax=Streptomyces sp. NPDC002619 TaxID=3364655 RepID=UPI0036A0F25E